MSELSDRDLLIRIDARTLELHEIVKGTESEPGLRTRVETMEREVARAKGWWAGAAAAMGTLWAGLEWFIHKR
jgi:hypothetical protein